MQKEPSTTLFNTTSNDLMQSVHVGWLLCPLTLVHFFFNPGGLNV